MASESMEQNEHVQSNIWLFDLVVLLILFFRDSDTNTREQITRFIATTRTLWSQLASQPLFPSFCHNSGEWWIICPYISLPWSVWSSLCFLLDETLVLFYPFENDPSSVLPSSTHDLLLLMHAGLWLTKNDRACSAHSHPYVVASNKKMISRRKRSSNTRLGVYIQLRYEHHYRKSIHYTLYTRCISLRHPGHELSWPYLVYSMSISRWWCSSDAAYGRGIIPSQSRRHFTGDVLSACLPASLPRSPYGRAY